MNKIIYALPILIFVTSCKLEFQLTPSSPFALKVLLQLRSNFFLPFFTQTSPSRNHFVTAKPHFCGYYKKMYIVDKTNRDR